MPTLHIDWTRCDGHGSCAELLPELLARDDWGFPVVRGETAAQPGATNDPEVSPHLRDHAERAVAACPALALQLVWRARER